MRVSTGCDAPIGKESSTCCSVPCRPESRAIAYSMQDHPVQQKPNKHAAMRRVGERTEIVRYSITYAPSPPLFALSVDSGLGHDGRDQNRSGYTSTIRRSRAIVSLLSPNIEDAAVRPRLLSSYPSPSPALDLPPSLIARKTRRPRRSRESSNARTRPMAALRPWTATNRSESAPGSRKFPAKKPHRSSARS
jgi:hypothetical protein